MHTLDCEVAAAGGHVIVARFFTPISAYRAAVLIAPAMGTTQTYYVDSRNGWRSRDSWRLRSIIGASVFPGAAAFAASVRISADIGAVRIGHFGFFRLRFAGTLWADHLLPELS